MYSSNYLLDTEGLADTLFSDLYIQIYDFRLFQPKNPVIVSQTADYALRAVVQLAHPGAGARTINRLAEETGVTASYLAKVLRPLIRGGLISAQRGPHGGYSLVSDPGRLSVLEVLNCVDPIPRRQPCPQSSGLPHGRLCLLHELLKDTTDQAEQRFARTSIASLLQGTSNSNPDLDPTPRAEP